MAKICILSALMLQLLYTLVQGRNSPCSDYNRMFNFTYIKNPESNETIGQFVIREPPVNKNLQVRLKMVFKVETQLSTASIVYGYSGRMNLTKSEEDASRDVLEGRPLLYHIYFPVQNPLPTLHRIWFNNVQICSGPKPSGNVVTTIMLEHTLRIIRPPQQAPRPVPPAPVDIIENYNECGISSRRSGDPNLLIAHGNKTLPGQWPWAAAIFRVIYEYEYLCGGTILTTKHVLTAGHCLKRSPRTNDTIPANILSVALGRYKLMDFNEQGSVTMDVARHIFHPEYTHTVSGDSDLAIIILRFPVEFTAFIRPICLLPPSVDSRRLEQTDGIIVGWGEDEYGNRYTEEPRLANMPIVRTDVCFRSDPNFYFITSERTFCAGGPDLTISGACNGDSGSGLVIFDSVTGRYHLRGVVSRTLGNQAFCDQTNYIVFVDVFKYLPWINNTLQIIIQSPQNQPNPPLQNISVEQKPPRPSQQAPRPGPQPAHVDKIENYNECGISSRHSGDPNLLIAHGNKTLPGEWPWVAAIFRVTREYKFVCGGTILTTKHVLTAGHCLKMSEFTNETIPAKRLSVVLGRHRLQDFNEQGSVTMDVARHISHPEYTHTATGDSDLAILILRSPIEFTAFIRPVCLLPPSVDSSKLEQKDGIVVGWGDDEHGNRYTEELRLATMTIVATDICVWNNLISATITSERIFCARWLHHSPCNVDSGSGLVVFDSVMDSYQLRGIVSRSLHGNQSVCDLSQYVVFVDVFKYLTWINQHSTDDNFADII